MIIHHMLRPPVIWALAGKTWHIALDTYPASADTACGLSRVPSTLFASEGHEYLVTRGTGFCQKCRSSDRATPRWPDQSEDVAS